LSPVLAVITLKVLEELDNKGIGQVLFADDGLFYSEEDKNFLEEAQAILDKHRVGAFFNESKCKTIKKDGI
jgi:hypothetical protein